MSNRTFADPRAWVHRLAVQRVLDGYSPDEVADFLEVHRSSVFRWVRAYQRLGDQCLVPVRPPGRPPQLSAAQQDQVLAWLEHKPQDLGVPAARWTAPCVAALIARRWHIVLHPHWLNRWLAARRVSPQVPQPVARERDPQRIDRWVHRDFPALKKRPGPAEPGSCAPTKAAF